MIVMNEFEMSILRSTLVREAPKSDQNDQSTSLRRKVPVCVYRRIFCFRRSTDLTLEE